MKQNFGEINYEKDEMIPFFGLMCERVPFAFDVEKSRFQNEIRFVILSCYTPIIMIYKSAHEPCHGVLSSPL